MVTIQGLGGIPEPKSDRSGRVRNEREGEAGSTAAAGASPSASSGDELKISSEAQAAAEVARLVALSQGDADIRADRVAAAKDAIARGDYKNPEVVARVAQNVSKYLP